MQGAGSLSTACASVPRMPTTIGLRTMGPSALLAMPAMPALHACAPEHWSARTTDANVVVLTVPGALARTRRFDVDVQLRVRVPAPAGSAEFSLSLEIDGARQWSRTLPGRTPGEEDTLEYHCRLVLEPGRDCRLRARAGVRRCTLVSLSLVALEERA